MIKLKLQGDTKQTWTPETWKPIKNALKELVQSGFLKEDEIQITMFRFEGFEHIGKINDLSD